MRASRWLTWAAAGVAASCAPGPVPPVPRAAGAAPTETSTQAHTSTQAQAPGPTTTTTTTAASRPAPGPGDGVLPRLGCDPVPGFDAPEPVPPGQGVVCGDGKRGTYTARCWRTVGGGGCGGPPPPSGPPQCLQATEVCDGADLDGQTCERLGFAGGRLACAGSCDGFALAGCAPCFARPGVSCRELAGVDHVDVAAAGDGAAAIGWRETTAAGGTWWLAIVTARGVTAAQPIARWSTGEAAPDGVALGWLGRGWAAWYLRDGRLWQRVFDDAGRATGDAVELADAVQAVVTDARDDRGAPRLVVLGAWPAGPRLFEVGPRGAGAPIAITRPVVGRLGERTAVLVPLAGAAADQADLAAVTAGGGQATSTLFRQGRHVGSTITDGPGVDLTFTAGRLTMGLDGDRFVTTWRPTTGRPFVVEHEAAAAPPPGVFASHPTVTPLRLIDGARTRLALATFAPPDAPPRLLTALVRGRRR